MGEISPSYTSPKDIYAGSIVNMTNTDQLLYKLELTLRNVREGKKGELIQLGPPRLNEEGINDVLGLVQSLVSRDTIMSNLDEREIQFLMMYYLIDPLILLLLVKGRFYGLTANDIATRNYILSACFNACYVCLKRGFEEGDKKFWKGSVQEIKTTTEGSGKSGWSSLNPFSKLGGN